MAHDASIAIARPAGPPVGVGGPASGVDGPPPGVVGARAAMEGTSSGFEGREQLLGQAVALAIRTLKDAMPYQHEMNDALVKMHLNAVQFAKNSGTIEDFVAHDVKTMEPMLHRMKGIIVRTGNKEVALIGMFDRTACLYQLCMDLHAEPALRSFTFPYTTVLTIARKIGQFDMTDQEVHEIWLKPRLLGYAAVLGVKINVSDIGPDNKVVVTLAG